MRLVFELIVEWVDQIAFSNVSRPYPVTFEWGLVEGLNTTKKLEYEETPA